MSVSVDFSSRVEELTGTDYLSVTPQPAALPSPVLTVCKDIVSGYSGDYVLFQFDTDEPLKRSISTPESIPYIVPDKEPEEYFVTV